MLVKTSLCLAALVLLAACASDTNFTPTPWPCDDGECIELSHPHVPRLGPTVTAEERQRRFQCHLLSGQELACYAAALPPAGTVHEAVFDPVAIGAAVGATTTMGKLTPASFTHDGRTTSITSLRWVDGEVVLGLSPYAALTGTHIDVIDGSGSVVLGLALPAATADSAAGTHTWALTDAPWVAGDKLMLRLRPSVVLPGSTS